MPGVSVRPTMSGDPTQAARPPPALGRKLLRWGAYLLAVVVVVVAATLAGLRLLLPELGHYRPEIERWLNQATDRQVEIGSIEAHWRGWTPVFRIREVRLAGGEAPADAPADAGIRLAYLTFSIDPLDLLRSRAFRPREISASGASFVIVRRSDGSFAVEELGALGTGGPRRRDRLGQWMLGQANLSLYASRIVWVDEQHGLRPLPLDGVTLLLHQAGDRRRISGSFVPPGAGRIDFATEMTGDPLTSAWSGTAYLAAHDVDIDPLGLDIGRSEAETLSGVVSGKVWSTWHDGRLAEAEGTIRVQSPGVVHEGHRRGFDEARASFKVEHVAQGWRLATRDLVVATPNGTWPPSAADAMWMPPNDEREGAVVVNAQFARIEDLFALAATGGVPVANPMLKTLFDGAPRGALEDLHVSVPVTDRFEIERVRASGRITGFGVGSGAWPVSVDAASGEFEASERGVVADVTGGRLRASFPDWLAHPVEGEKLAGAFAAIPTPEGVRLRFARARLATSAGTITAQGRMLVPRDESAPELSIDLSLGASRIAPTRDLIAGRVLPDAAARWFEAAAPFGDVHEARLTFRGRLSDAPLAGDAGRLEATAKLVVPVFSYARGWPEITDATATVRFDGRRFDARIDSGRILKSTIREARATIENVRATVPVVRVEGRVEGASANAVRFVAESPLRRRFAPMIDAFAIHGDSTIDLALDVPLKGADRSVTAEGRIALDHNRIDGPGLGRGLAAVNGLIAFRGSTVESDGITATWLDEPIHALIGPSPATPNATRVSIGGRLTRRLLSAYLHEAGLLAGPMPDRSPLLARIRGDTAWSATLDIPAAGDGRPATLRIASDLTGLTVDLPPPFGKTGGTARMLEIHSRITPGTGRTTEFRLGALASAVLRMVPDGDRYRLDRGAIRIGGGPAALPDAPGISVEGAVPALDAGAWNAFLRDFASLRPPDPDAPRLGLVRELSIDAGSMTALGMRFPETRIRAKPGADGGWRLDLAGPHLEGVVHLPRDLQAEPVTTEFERFVYEADSDGTGSESPRLDPRTLPALSFSTRRFVLGERDVGRVGFTTSPGERGLEIERLDVRTDAFEGEATGSWSLAGGEHRTDLQLRLYGVALGPMIESLGFDGNTVSGGETYITLRGSWPGTPGDFELGRYTGVMHFMSTDGRLTQLEPGVTGHVFGLLTITSLPRRLILDFGDLFKEGLGYDRIEGRFAIENGNAYTDDLFMESDTARFEVVGRTGLATREYDQLVTVIPKVSSSLPLAPIWLAQKLLRHNVFDKAFAYQYTVAGSWDEPDVELVRTQRREDDPLP